MLLKPDFLQETWQTALSKHSMRLPIPPQQRQGGVVAGGVSGGSCQEVVGLRVDLEQV